MAAKQNKLYAFWKYDQFPYVLGGEATKAIKDSVSGKVYYQIKGYDGMQFLPLKVVDLSVGLKIQKKLDDLQIRRNAFLKQANDMFELELKAINAGFI